MRKEWTENETELLKEKYNSVSNEELLKLFPDRSFTLLYKKARKLGLYKDQDIEFINRSLARKGSCSSTWNGGIRITSHGYRQILRPEHPRADKSGYVIEHIVIFEEETGISIPDHCCIHHLNGDKSDNRISNLCMMTHGGHTTFHHTGNKLSEETKNKIKQSKRRKLNEQSNISSKIM